MLSARTISSTMLESSSRKKPHRAQVACTRCRSQKLRCDGLIPCSRCIRAKVPCADPLHRTRDLLSQDEHAHTLLRLSSASQQADVSAQSPLARHQSSTDPASSTHDASVAPALVQRLQQDMKDVLGRLDVIEARIGVTTGVESRRPAPADHDRPPLRSSAMHESVRAPFTDMMEKGADESNVPSRSSSPEFVDPSESTTAAAGQAQQSSSWGNGGPFHSANLQPHRDRQHRMSNKAAAPAIAIKIDGPCDPISSGLISVDVAAWLLDWFLKHCHPFLPVLDARVSDGIEQMQDQAPFLLTTILAISLRFEALRTCHIIEAGATAGLSESLVQMTENLLGQTLLRSRFRLSDVQAVLFLHAWGLRPIGQGSDPWILSGHAFRLAKRLGIEKTVTSSHSFGSDFLASRRTWLLLCASDCFPSLGFGRPFSPKENLDLCVHIIARLKHDHLFQGIDIGPDAFVVSQGELAQISRRLLDWVADASSQLNSRNEETRQADRQSWIDVESIWTRYQELNQSLQTCEAQWNEGLLSPVAKISAALYRWHVRLCLPSFALRLNDIADRTHIARSRNQNTDGRKETASKASRYRLVYRQAILRSSEAIVRLHAQDEGMLTYVPDYLVMALAQACSSRIGLLESEINSDRLARRVGSGREDEAAKQTGAGLSEQRYSKQETDLVASALATLERLASQGVSLARYLSAKVADAAQKARLPIPHRSSLRQRKAAATNESEEAQAAKRLKRADRSSAGNVVANLGSGNGTSDNIVPTWSSTSEAQGHQMDAHISPATSSLQDLLEAKWPEADDLDLWFDADDPLRLLFGENVDLLPANAFDIDMDVFSATS